MNKKITTGIIVCILLVLAVVGFSWYSEKHKDDKFVKEIERNITTEDRKVYEDRVVEYTNKLTSTNESGVRYNLYIQLGQTNYILGHLQNSKENFLEAIKISPNQYDSHLGLFLTQVDMTDFKGAEESIKKSISIRKGVADLWKKYIQFKIDRLNASNEEISKLFDTASQDIDQNGDVSNRTDISTFYAKWLENVGNFQSAIDNWKKAIEFTPENKKIYQAEIDRLQKLLPK